MKLPPVVVAEQDAEAWREIERKLHRPQAMKCGPPEPPRNGVATTWPELVWMLRERRKQIGISSLAFDDKIGWTDGQTGKYEIPHANVGRVPGPEQLKEWLQGLGVGIVVVTL